MPDDNKTAVRRFYAEVSEGNLAIVDELLADDFVEHEEFPGIEPTKEGVRQFFGMFRAAFPDLHMEPHEVVAEDDLVTARVIFTGTQQGEFMGVPPSGKRIEVQAIDMLRIRDGQATEHWGVLDGMTMMQQLGAIPAEAPA